MADATHPARLWAFFGPGGRLLTATDYESGLAGTEHALSFHHVGPFTRVEYVRVGADDAPAPKPLRPSK